MFGEKTLGPGADIYSVGAVLYELLGGRAPYDADSDIATLAKLLKEVHDPLATVRPELPAKLCAFVDSLLVKEPERRAKDALKVKESLLAIVKAGDLSTLFDIATESAARTNTSGTPRPPSGPARLPNTSPGGRRNSVTKMPAQAAQTMDEEPPQPRPSVKRPPRRVGTPAPKPAASATSLESVDDAPPPPKSRAGVFIGVAIALVGITVGAGLFLALGKGSDEPVVVEAPPKPTKPKSNEPKIPFNVVVTLKAEPANTRFEVDGEKLEGNPLSLTRTKDSAVSVIATAQGYEPRTLRLTFKESHEETVALTRLVASASTDPTPDPTPTPTVKPTKTGGTKTGPGKKGGKLTVDETNPYE